MTNRVKDNLIQNCVLGWLSAQGWKLRKTTTTKYEQRVRCSTKSSVVVALWLLPTERIKKLRISKCNRKRKVVANEMYTAKLQNKISLTKAEEKATSAYSCQTCECTAVVHSTKGTT
jgi:hypothetical protein